MVPPSTPSGSGDFAAAIPAETHGAGVAIVVPRRLLSADEALAFMPAYSAGFVPSWADHIVAPRRLNLLESALIRLLDIVFALFGLILLSPVVAAIAIAIRIDTPGPAVFKQTRLGKGLKPFKFYKFRTLHADAKERFPELYRYDYSDEEIQTMRFKSDEDPRQTKVGRVLRRTSLDELPNLINVLLGDISLVGPRPEIPEMFRYYEPWQCAKWHVKPGATGYAQIEGRGHLTLQETMYWDVRFVLERSIRTYFQVLVRTVWAVGKGIGAF